ncbi:hypothetical protein BN946_scf184857.g48 [Trametes cinnabarina]|uniref:SAP domain-containing protein n=1 Tax=Pycnoporus cinnabarinus TaxID=5643 RepID=A0A060STI0_PYCCI|nr:hypothetical protein BN946_scf184857.g48 [Trametes cinnabarina]
MATTTQILFNSPALHSLKRDQLVKLCKIHSIKANGKNTELIERLKQHAQALPPGALGAPDQDDAMEVEDRLHDADEDEDEDIPGGFSGGYQGVINQDCDDAMDDVILTSRFGIPRPSEQWEVVMDDIEEVDETLGTMSSKGSLRTVSNGEFGTHASKGSVTSSLKALATSLGIKRPGGKSVDVQDSDNGTANSKNRLPSSLSPGKLFSAKARDSLAEHATPYSQLPPAESLPDTDDFKFTTPDASILGLDGEGEDTNDAPVPGASGRAGKPAPLGARLSMGVGQSTIRLVTQPAVPRFADAYMSPPRLPVIQPDFDIKMGTPSAGRMLSVWPASPRTADAADDGEERLYPKLPVVDFGTARGAGNDPSGGGEDVDVSMPGGMSGVASTETPGRVRTMTGTSTSTATPRPLPLQPGPVDVPDLFSPSKAATIASTGSMLSNDEERPAMPRSAPFLFGSPLPRRETPKRGAQDGNAGAGVSNIAFEGAAKSVLEEMHRRLAEAQKEKEKNGEVKPASSTEAHSSNSLFAGFTFGTANAREGAGAGDRFAKVHEAEFAKMDSIANHYAARRPAANNRKRKSDVLGPGGPRAGQKRRSSAAGARVISNGVRKKMAVPGGFGGDDDEVSASEEEAEDARSKATQDDVEDAGARRSSKRMRITEGWDVHRGQRVSIAPPLPPAEEEKKRKEKDAIKRELEAAKARRRSSRGRPSMGGKGAVPAKGKASRFGFLSSAKSIVRNVWNMGAGSKGKSAPAPPSSIPVAKPKPAPSVVATSKNDGDAQKTGKGAASKAVPATASASQNSRKPFGTHSRIPSVSSTTKTLLKPSTSNNATDTKATGTVASTKSSSSRARSPLPSFTQPATQSKSAHSASRASSLSGTARSYAGSTAAAPSASHQPSRTSTVSSIGARTSLASGASTAVSSMGTRRSLAVNATDSKAEMSKTAAEGHEQTSRKRTSSLLAPTASSLARMNTAVRPSLSGRAPGLSSVAEKQKRPSAIAGPSKIPAKAAGNRMTSMSPSSGRIFSQPLTNFGSPAATAASPAPDPSFGAAATVLFASADESSPSKIPRPAVIPPKPKALIARKPRISRSRVIAKLGAQRAAAAQGSAASPSGRTRSSFGARRSFGGVKAGRASAGSEVMRGAAKRRARQSEYIRRKSRAGASDTENLVVGED